MICSNCGTKLKALTEGVHVDEGGVQWMFCNRDCLRAWLGPDRPLSRRVEAAQSGGLSPQHIVSCGPSCLYCAGEIKRGSLETLTLGGFPIATKLR